ncbi:MAG: protein kinase [Myxococcales bacterium]|nr:protein kinase [Myxococcales bacterium]
MSGLVGATVAQRYELIEAIGRGGMGDVYRALDRELDEEIALKVVHDALVAVPGVLERFRAEVKLARRVTHKNVARTYELGRADGLTYFTMELVTGESLTERLRPGPLAPPLAIAIAVELCDALAAAHAVGVIHRDLKPDNVMLARDGRVVLTDFGVAALSVGGDASSSGTPRYMAPEQVRGEPPSPLVDVYALGLVLYEMVTGRPGFAGTVATVLDAKQATTPIDLAGVEPSLAAVIARAMAHEPTLRWPGVAALRAALAPERGPGAALPMAPARRGALALPTVLVVPPQARSADAHRVVGFHHELVGRLARRSHLRLLRRPGGEVDGGGARVAVIARDQVVVEIDVGGRVDRLALTIPSEPAALVAGAELASRVIAAVVGAGPERDHGEVPIAAPALEHLWRAQALSRRTEVDRAAAHHEFAAAAALAPGDPRILAGLAMCEVRAAFFRDRPEPEALRVAADHATSAVLAAPQLAEAQIAVGHVRLHQGDPTAAAVHFRAAIARAPYLPEAHEWLGRMLLEAGYLVDGEARVADVLAMAPDLEAPRWDLARAYALEERWPEHDRVVAELAALTGVLPGRFGWQIRLAGWRGDRATIAAIRAEVEAAPLVSMFERTLVTAVCDALLGAPWAPVRDQIVATVAAPDFGSARRRAFIGQIVAEAAGALGDVATAVAMLRLAVEHGLFDRHWLARCPHLDGVRADPAYPALAAQVAARAEAVQDALFGDHGGRAVADTMLNAGATR